MNPKDAFHFCPKCGNDLKKHDENLLTCSSCGFHFYINPQPSTAALITNENGHVMLVKRKHDPMAGYWDLPGGFMHPFESLWDAVSREVHEELGVVFSPQDIIGVYEDKYLYQGVENGTLCIAVSGTIPTTATLVPDDDITAYAFFSERDVYDQPIAFPSMTIALQDFFKKT